VAVDRAKKDTVMYKNLIGILVLTCTFSSCAVIESEPSAAAEVSFEQSKQLWPLDVKFSYVSLRNIRMDEAITFLSKVIREHPGKIPRFLWSIDVGPPSVKPPPYKNPLVSIETSNVTLRDILNRLCAQAGWTYNEMMERQWISFHAAPK
jgi:hypothetical protein